MPYKDPAVQREYARQWLAKRRAEFFADKSCAICGAVNELELDHIDPTQKVEHRIWSWSQERRDAEIAKCQVLCTDCHHAKTIDELPLTRGDSNPAYTHGTLSMYRHHECRCVLCSQAASEAWHEWKQRTTAES